MTKAEIDALKIRAGGARASCRTLTAALAPLRSEVAHESLTHIDDFLRNVENVLTAAGDVIGDMPDPG